MRQHLVPFVVAGLSAVAVTAACSGGHGTLFASSASTGSGGGGSGGHGTGTAGSTGSGGQTGTGGDMSTSTTSSSSGTATTSSSSGSTTTSSGTYPAAFPAPPQVVTFGGAVLASPKIYPVFFSNDDSTTVTSLADFSKNVGATPYWTAATSEYGVGQATGEAPIKLAETAPATIDDTAIQQWLATKFATAGSGFPVPDANTLIIIYYPQGTTVTLQGNKSCQSFGGYHQGATVGGGKHIAYAVVPRCGNLDLTTSAASHELVEASTDPQPQTDPAYAQVDEGDLYWELLLGGGETGDMCAQFPGVFVKFSPFNYAVQRTWSNKAAVAGQDPCVPPLPGEVYFNAAPVLPDIAPLKLGTQTAMVKAVQIPVGGTKTIPVQLFSDGPVGPWTVGAVDPAPSLGSPQLLNLSVSPTSGKNGDIVQLTIKVLQAGPGNLEAFYVTSKLGTQEAIWFGAVSN